MAVVHSGLGFQELWMNRFKIISGGERGESSDFVELLCILRSLRSRLHKFLPRAQRTSPYCIFAAIRYVAPFFT
jgi:hypothetical protein